MRAGESRLLLIWGRYRGWRGRLEKDIRRGRGGRRRTRSRRAACARGAAAATRGGCWGLRARCRGAGRSCAAGARARGGRAWRTRVAFFGDHIIFVYITLSPCTADNLSAELESDGLPGLDPLMLPVRRPDDDNLAHGNRLGHTRPSARADEPDRARVHEDPLARHADEAHLGEHGEVLSVLELDPYASLRAADERKCAGVWRDDGAAGQRGEEAVAEEDGEDAEILGGVRDGRPGEASAACILEA